MVASTGLMLDMVRVCVLHMCMRACARACTRDLHTHPRLLMCAPGGVSFEEALAARRSALGEQPPWSCAHMIEIEPS